MKNILIALTLSVGFVFAQAQTITGTVTDQSGVPLPGATVLVEGTNNGVSTDFDGNFSIQANTGDTLVVSFVGYASQNITVSSDTVLNIALASGNVSLEEITVSSKIIDIAKERETPIAVSAISAQEISAKIGNQEFPEIMNRTPGVYATKQGGGYGDSRISLRGFDQRNTSFLINGQPVNDMENGWVYWSNWQGLTEVASGIQIQRGLGASRLAVPSVGGTVSIFTKTAEREEGGSFNQLIGNDGYTKTSFIYNTGKNENGWASSYLLSKWSGDGYVYNTSGEGWTYFFAVGYAPDDSNHALNLSVLGAGQWHHQRDVWVSIRDFEYFGEDGIDPRWNSNGGTLNGSEYSMRRNFYNKPLATLNWDWQIADNISLATSFYASAGRGGGTGPRGNNYRNSDIDILPFRRDLYDHLGIGNGNPVAGTKARNADGTINFDRVVQVNRSSTDPYTGDISRFNGLRIGSNGYRDFGVNRATLIRRASMNSHDWVGAISNLDIVSGKMRYSFGIDVRNYKGYHYRVVNDLLGLDGYYSTGNKNSAGQIIETLVEASPFKNTGIRGPKIDYYNNGIVGWQGFNFLAEYNSEDKFNAVFQAGTSNQSFQREDFFDQPGNPISVKKNVGGGYVKGGANYNFSEKANVFFNAGYISRQPNFDAVFPNYANNVNPDLQNEKITSVELGYGYLTNTLRLNVNLYSTNWGNRFVTRSLTNSQGVDGTAQFKNIDVQHNGIEIEGSYRPEGSNLQLRGMLSIGDWRYTKDFDAALFDDNQVQVGTGTLYTKDAKVGDAAQFTSYWEAEYRIGSSLNVDLGLRTVDGLYADYSITDSDFTTPNNKGALKLPGFSLVDLGSTYYFQLFGHSTSLRLNINNLFNTTYIAESNSNIHATSGSDTWNGIDKSNYVWFGFGTTWNLSLRYRF